MAWALGDGLWFNNGVWGCSRIPKWTDKIRLDRVAQLTVELEGVNHLLLSSMLLLLVHLALSVAVSGRGSSCIIVLGTLVDSFHRCAPFHQLKERGKGSKQACTHPTGLLPNKFPIQQRVVTLMN